MGRNGDNLPHYLHTFFFLQPHTEGKFVNFSERHTFCCFNWLKFDGSKNRADGGTLLMQHLNVCPVWHMDGIKFDLGS